MREQFLECEASLRGMHALAQLFEIGAGRRPMHVVQRVFESGQVEGIEYACRHEVSHRALRQQREGQVGQHAQAPLLHAFGRRIDGRQRVRL